jgi:hypothetical protein
MSQANKHVLMAADLQPEKYLKFITRKIHRNIQIMNLPKGKFGFGGTSSPRLHLFKFKPGKSENFYR